ncbi:MAG: acyl-CoA synthetase [Pseudohongiellaceae bacterium]
MDDQPQLDDTASIRAFEQAMPLSERFPLTSALDIIRNSAQRFGDDAALTFLPTGARDEAVQTISYRELAARVMATANLLQESGVTHTDTVSIILPILPQSHPVILGSQAQAIANPINPLLEPGQIADIMRGAGARAVVCLAPSRHTDIWEKTMQAVEQVPDVHTVLAIALPGLTGEVPEPGLPDRDIRVVDYNEAVARQPSDALRSPRQFTGDEIAACFHTGGTTGHPKIARLTHGNMAYIGQLMQVVTAHMGRQTVICGLPLFHIFGVIIQGVAAFAVGYHIVLLTPSGFRNTEALRNLWHHVERFRVNSFATVPTVLTALSQMPVGSHDISSLTRINSGAAPLSPSFEESFERRFHLIVTNGYGMTETTSLITRPPDEQPAGSVGLRLPYSEVRIAEVEEDRITRDCLPGEPGAILVRGPQVFAGYVNETDNRGAFPEGDWFNTGDLGYLDEEGFLYLTGRSRDLIIRGGHNIDPALIEEALHAHPGVASAIAVGQPDAYAGELPMAFVVPSSGRETSEEALLAWCRSRINERAAVPKRIVFVKEMPVTAVGKVFRPALRERITGMVINETLQEAGLEATVESVRYDKTRGMEASLVCRDEQQHEAMRELLAPLPVNVSVHLSRPPGS